MNNFFNELGYEPITTFWQDFSIADRFIGVEKDPVGATYKRALAYAKTDYKVFTELVLVLNHKIWAWYQVNDVLAIEYDTLWKMAENEFFKLFEDNEDACAYYYRVTD